MKFTFARLWVPTGVQPKSNPEYFKPDLIEPLVLHPACFVPFPKTMNNPQYYAAKDDAEVFTFGPHPTPEAALDAVLRDMKMEQLTSAHVSDGPYPDALPNIEDGLILKVGILETHVPAISAIDLLDELADDAGGECGEVADGFLSNVSFRERTELEDALNLVLEGWLHRYGLMPTFGAMSDVRRYMRVKKVDPYLQGWMPLTHEPGDGVGIQPKA